MMHENIITFHEYNIITEYLIEEMKMTNKRASQEYKDEIQKILELIDIFKI